MFNDVIYMIGYLLTILFLFYVSSVFSVSPPLPLFRLSEYVLALLNLPLGVSF